MDTFVLEELRRIRNDIDAVISKIDVTPREADGSPAIREAIVVFPAGFPIQDARRLVGEGCGWHINHQPGEGTYTIRVRDPSKTLRESKYFNRHNDVFTYTGRGQETVYAHLK